MIRPLNKTIVMMIPASVGSPRKAAGEVAISYGPSVSPSH
jgi:hypothetical protein